MEQSVAIFYFAAIAAFVLVLCGLAWLLERAGVR